MGHDMNPLTQASKHRVKALHAVVATLKDGACVRYAAFLTAI